MATKNSRPTNGTSFGAKYTLTSDAVNVAAVAEVVTLVATEGAITADGNASVTLPSLPAVTIALLHEASFDAVNITFNTGCSTSGNVGITLSTALGEINTAVVDTDNTPTLVADKIRANAAAFTGWTVGGTAGNVTFVCDTAGPIVGTAAVNFNSTGVTSTLGLVHTVVGAVADSTPTLVATKIRAASYTGWTPGGSGVNVTFTKNVAGAVSGSPVFSAGGTGATATITITTPGADAINGYVDFDFRAVPGSGALRFPLVANVIVTRAGVITMPSDLSIAYPVDGVVRVDGTLVAGDVVHVTAQRDSEAVVF